MDGKLCCANSMGSREENLLRRKCRLVYRQSKRWYVNIYQTCSCSLSCNCFEVDADGSRFDAFLSTKKVGIKIFGCQPKAKMYFIDRWIVICYFGLNHYLVSFFCWFFPSQCCFLPWVTIIFPNCSNGWSCYTKGSKQNILHIYVKLFRIFQNGFFSPCSNSFAEW